MKSAASGSVTGHVEERREKDVRKTCAVEWRLVSITSCSVVHVNVFIMIRTRTCVRVLEC